MPVIADRQVVMNLVQAKVTLMKLCILKKNEIIRWRRWLTELGHGRAAHGQQRWCREAKRGPEGSIPNSDRWSGGGTTPQIWLSPFWQTTSKRAFQCGLMNRRESPAWGTHRLQGRSYQLQASVGVIRASCSRTQYYDMKGTRGKSNFPVCSLAFLSHLSVLCNFQSIVCIFCFSSPGLSSHLLLFLSWFLHTEVGSGKIFFQRENKCGWSGNLGMGDS